MRSQGVTNVKANEANDEKRKVESSDDEKLNNEDFVFQIEGEFEQDSEVRATYKDLHAKRPVCQKLLDHDEQIQPNEPMDETSEYRSTMNKLQVE